jgi:hypothetical protein
VGIAPWRPLPEPNRVEVSGVLDPQLHIRCIHITSPDRLLLEAIPFRYSLVAEHGKRYRLLYHAQRLDQNGQWRVEKL